MIALRALNRRFENAWERALSSWQAAALVIFLVFAFAARLLDDFPILPDGLRTLGTAGYFDAAFDLSALFERLMSVSQQHVPGYFLALSAWANLAGWDVLVLRSLTLFFGLLSLALVYRLARDVIAPEAGWIALVMLASLAFYNYWYLPLRMYTMFVAAELLLLWIYLRLARRDSASIRDYAALFLACVFFLSTHIFSLALGAGLAVLHLLGFRKSRHWLLMALSGMAAGGIFLPWMDVALTGSAEIAAGDFGQIQALTPIELVEEVFSLGTNASVLFLLPLALSLRGLWRRERLTISLWLSLIVALGVYILVNHWTRGIDLHRARYFVILFPLIILLIIQGLRQLRRWKLAVALILAFWVASGMLYQRRVGADFYVRSYGTIPVHLIERQLRDALQSGDLISGWTRGLNFDYRTSYGGVIDFTFADHDVEVAIENNYALRELDDEAIAASLRQRYAGIERVWLVYERDNVQRYRDLFISALDAAHKRCASDDSVANTVIALYQLGGCD